MADRTPVMDPMVAELLREFADSTVGGLQGEEAVSLSSAILGRGRLPRPASALARAVEETFDEVARAQASAILKHVGCELLHSSEELGDTLWRESDSGAGGALGDFNPPYNSHFDRAMTSAPRIRALLGKDAATVLEFFEGRHTQEPAACLALLGRAQRLAADDDTLILLALAQCSAGQSESALRILLPLRERPHRAALHNLIDDNVGLAYSKLGEHEKAALAYSRPALRSPCRAVSSISWLLNALQAGDSTSAIEAARIIGAAPGVVHAMIATTAGAFRASRLAGHWRVRPAALETLSRIAPKLGPLATQVTDALH